jgi:uncharacterized protein YbjT (DUF2867 family)
MNKEQDVILVTGATGQQGGATARELLAAGFRVAALTRNPHSEKAAALAELGAEIVQGDLEDEASLRQALDGKWGVFAVQTFWEVGIEGEARQGKFLAQLAKEAGVQHFVYSSVGSAHQATGIPHFESKFKVEEAIRELNFKSFVILRPVFFMENLRLPDTTEAVANGSLPLAMPSDRALQVIALADIGRYGRLAFENHESWNGQAIDIASDELTPAAMAKVLSDVSGREVGHYQVPLADVRAFSDDYAIMFEWFDAHGYSADIPGNAESYGLQPTQFSDWAAQLAW